MRIYIERGKELLRENNAPSREATLINIRRTIWQALFAMGVNVALILLMAIVGSDDLFFRDAIFISQGSMFIVMATSCIVSYMQRGRAQPSRFALIMQNMSAISVMSAGIIVTAVDKTGTGVIAYIVVCLIAGVASIMRPLRSGITYLIGFTAFITTVHLTASSLGALASTAIYGTIATVFGYVMTVMIWRGFKTNQLQREHLREQKAALEKANTELRSMAYLDPLTNLPNRRLLDDMIRKEVSRAVRHGHSSSIIMMDIDHFKRINDLFGHPAGDSLLIQFGELLAANMRRYDILSRLAGDEFVVLLPQTDLKQAKAVAEKLRALICGHAFSIGGEEMNITASFGVSELAHDENTTLIKQYAIADDALYRDKSKRQDHTIF